ncbi:MAG: rod shape-determining protein MreD [Marinilabiliales bacterium]|nr:MAG: rod shape-determining protein MreD [Marinilabiliales bacterium]
MIKQNLRYILLFIFSVLIQTLIFDRIYLSGYVTVLVYVMFTLLLPINTNRYLVLTYAFILGLCVDIFNSTQGIHASASVLLAFLRPYILNLFAPRDDYDINKVPAIRNYGFIWFIKYIGILIFIHHLYVFYLEYFSFANFFFTLLRVVISTVVSMFFVTLGHFLFVRE